MSSRLNGTLVKYEESIFNNNLVSLGNDPNDGTEYHGKSSGHQG